MTLYEKIKSKNHDCKIICVENGDIALIRHKKLSERVSNLSLILWLSGEKIGKHEIITVYKLNNNFVLMGD